MEKIEALPLEIILNILSYLTPTALGTLALVAKSMKHIAEDNYVWKSFLKPLYKTKDALWAKRCYLEKPESRIDHEEIFMFIEDISWFIENGEKDMDFKEIMEACFFIPYEMIYFRNLKDAQKNPRYGTQWDPNEVRIPGFVKFIVPIGVISTHHEAHSKFGIGDFYLLKNQAEDEYKYFNLQSLSSLRYVCPKTNKMRAIKNPYYQGYIAQQNTQLINNNYFDAAYPTALPNTFNGIPPEMLLKIFNHLKIHDLAKVARLSKALKEIAEDNSLWNKYLKAPVQKPAKAKSILLTKPESRIGYEEIFVELWAVGGIAKYITTQNTIDFEKILKAVWQKPQASDTYFKQIEDAQNWSKTSETFLYIKEEECFYVKFLIPDGIINNQFEQLSPNKKFPHRYYLLEMSHKDKEEYFTLSSLSSIRYYCTQAKRMRAYKNPHYRIYEPTENLAKAHQDFLNNCKL